MSTDKTLQCKDCGTDFIFTAREQEFYAQKGFKTSPPVAKLVAITESNREMVAAEAAVMVADAIAAANDKCSRLFARPVAHKPKFLSSQIQRSPFIAAIALKNRATAKLI